MSLKRNKQKGEDENIRMRRSDNYHVRMRVLEVKEVRHTKPLFRLVLPKGLCARAITLLDQCNRTRNVVGAVGLKIVIKKNNINIRKQENGNRTAHQILQRFSHRVRVRDHTVNRTALATNDLRRFDVRTTLIQPVTKTLQTRAII
jgi:hypothetical protein